LKSAVGKPRSITHSGGGGLPCAAWGQPRARRGPGRPNSPSGCASPSQQSNTWAALTFGAWAALTHLHAPCVHQWHWRWPHQAPPAACAGALRTCPHATHRAHRHSQEGVHHGTTAPPPMRTHTYTHMHMQKGQELSRAMCDVLRRQWRSKQTKEGGEVGTASCTHPARMLCISSRNASSNSSCASAAADPAGADEPPDAAAAKLDPAPVCSKRK
jgi:hypothetical protein